MTPKVSRRQPIDPDIPLVPVSRLLLIPSHRPGRQQRYTSVDPTPSVSYGDPVIQKVQGSIRLFFQNVKGLTYTSTKEDYNYYFKCLQGLDVDIVGLSETNTCWSHHHLSSEFRSTTRKYARQSKTAFGIVSPDIDRCMPSETFQSGGNLTCILGSLVSRVVGSDILDATGLGRWSGVKLEGPERKKLAIITAYRVCSGSPQTAPIGSSFLREYEYFRGLHHASPNPRRLFFVDLQQTILALQDSGYSIILMLDANSTLDDTQLLDFLARCGLHDLHSRDPPPSTYIGSSGRRIDFIYGCDDARRYVIRSGSLAYTEGPQSDHRSLYIDISSEFISTPPWQSITSSQLRDLYTGNPEKVTMYHNSMLTYYQQHRMAERIQQLFDLKDSMDREKLRSELIKWDNDQGRAMELSERNLRRPRQKCSWSPVLRNAAILRRYWLLRLREKLRDEDYTATFHRWQQVVQSHDSAFRLPFLGQSLPIEHIRASLNQATREFRRCQKHSIPLRLRTYQELLETYQDDDNPTTKGESRRKAKIIQTTIAGESLRHVFSNLRQVVRPSVQSGISKVMVPSNTSMTSSIESAYRITQDTSSDDILWETVVTREDIDRHLLQYNRDSFRAASSSPCGHGVIHDALTFTSLSPASEEELLAGNIPPSWCVQQDNHLREFLASFVIPPQVYLHGDIPTEISEDDAIHGFRAWKESTSTSPSGRHLGHYKAVIQHPLLLKCFVQFMNIVVSRGIAVPRWCNATNVMIEKDPGLPRIHRLRIIHLFEADYNFFLKLQWGHRLVRHAVSLDLLHDSQYGSIPRRTAMEPIMLTQLTSDLCRILKHDLARFDNDASACYDRIIVALGMLAARRCGMPSNAIRLHAEALQFMKYTVKTVHGISDSNYQGTPFAPLFGTGQGSGASPAVWLTLVVLLLQTFDRLIPHRMNFAPISGARSHSRSSDAFVDDTSVGFTSSDNTSYSDLISRLEQAAQTWEKLLTLSGGKLNLSKCSWYILRWDWQNGRPIIRKQHQDDRKVVLTSGVTSNKTTIQRQSLESSSRMLGVYLNPMGDFSDHLKMMKKKADDFSRRILSPRLTETDVAIFHRSIYIPSMRYSLAAIAADEESLSFVQTNVIKSRLQKFHISSKIPTSLRHGPTELGGLGLYDLRTEAGIEAIKFLRNSLYSDSEAGNLIRLNLQYSQREAGVGFHLLEKPTAYISYLTPSWILSIRQFLANNNMSIRVSDVHCDQLKSPTDDFIMSADHLKRYSPSQQRDINLVRIWLQVTTLSELADPERPNRILLTFLDAKRPENFHVSETWPRQCQPTKSQCRLWKRFLSSSFLRYIPYWKITPVSPLPADNVVASHPVPPTDFAAYMVQALSRTERRLLDGLEQVASDLRIWRAFRSKSRLHLASDGGLGEASATHGWVLSSGTEVLYQCSGPVDGPIDTNSSTRSELGGCASSLLFLSSLSRFWGLRHRCSFRWYTDSTSAIRRFHKHCGRSKRSTQMPPDSDLLSIISSCLKQLKRPFKPRWVRAHQDDSMAYDRLPLAARLNIAADFLATRYRQHGRLRAIEMVDHQIDHQVSIYINRLPVTSQHDDCIRFHVNGYHHRNYVQQHHGWDNRTWESIDFYTFGKHFKRLRPLHRVQHFKFIHDQLPLGERRYREAPIKDELLKLCPCCRDTEESPLHFTRCQSNPVFQSSLDTLRSDILNSDSHPVRYLLADGFCHTINSDTPYAPSTAQYPSHFQDLISEALESQLRIGWNNSLKGYFSRSWGHLAQYDMHRKVRDSQKGEQRM